MSGPDSTKTCTVCNTEKPLSEYRKPGRVGKCRDCERRWHREHARRRRAEWIDYGTKFCGKCQTEMATELFSRGASWCRSCTNAYSRTYREQNAERVKRQTAEWKRRNRLRVNVLEKRYRQKARSSTFALYGSRCGHCGFDDERALQIDHIQPARDGGKGKRGIYRAGTKLYSAILRGDKDRGDFQLLCVNCNWIKRVVAKECARIDQPLVAKWQRHWISNRRVRARIKAELLALYEPRCCKCGFSDSRALHLDHIHGAKAEGDNRDSIYRAGVPLYAAILRGDKDKERFQLLCANCNWIKRYEAGEHNGG